ncbi:MAG: DNA-directed RNA polymerase subunit L [Thermoprotei archaeon]|nr:MAG: DNA-directed RNA polymerase subunit L [Thermoprotei archaeon]
MEAKIRGEGHTLLNMIVDELNRNPHVTYAAYSVDHPLVNEARLIVTTDGSIDPLDALTKASSNLKSFLKELREQFVKVLEGTEE